MRIISFKQMKEMRLCIWSRAHLDREEEANRFPKRVVYGTCRVGWVEDEVIAHNQKLADARNTKTTP